MRLLRRLRDAEARLALKVANSQRVVKEHQGDPAASLETSFALRNARLEESAAREEYMRILAEFTEFTLRGKPYEDEFLA